MNIFNFDEWNNKKIVVHCRSHTEAVDFCQVMHNSGKRWRDGFSYLRKTEWEEYKETTCYFFNEGLYGNINSAKSLDYVIIEWSDYINKIFTKTDLRSGDVIIKRNGAVEIVCVETGTLICCNGFNFLRQINENLTSRNGHIYDIIDIYRPESPQHCAFFKENYEQGRHIYHRE